ncbi:MAG: DJ-1/PfpI family protein [Bacteroidales bacterium]
MQKVLLFLPKGFEELEATALIDVLGWSRAHGTNPVTLHTAGLHNEITSAWGSRVIPTLPFSQTDADSYDAMAIPGGFETAGYYEDAFDESVLETIREFNRQGKPIASVCVGALPLGRAGILKNRPATTYALPHGERRQQLAAYGAIVQDVPLVIDQHIITSEGPATAIDVAFSLLGMLTNEENVQMVKKIMRVGRG